MARQIADSSGDAPRRLNPRSGLIENEARKSNCYELQCTPA
jgi:hypothetical protein